MQNEDLNMCLTISEGHNSRRDRERDMRARICKGKRPVDLNQQAKESSVQGGHEERPHRENSSKRSQPKKTRHKGSRNTQENHMNVDMEDLKKKYTKLSHQLACKEKKSTAKELMDNTNLPFTYRVLCFPLLDKIKMPCVDKYDGNGDPAEHVENLCHHFSLHGTPDEIACRTFPLTLVGIAKDCFARLPTKSVDNFKDL